MGSEMCIRDSLRGSFNDADGAAALAATRSENFDFHLDGLCLDSLQARAEPFFATESQVYVRATRPEVELDGLHAEGGRENSSKAAMTLAAYINEGPPPM